MTEGRFSSNTNIDSEGGGDTISENILICALETDMVQFKSTNNFVHILLIDISLLFSNLRLYCDNEEKPYSKTRRVVPVVSHFL